LYTLYLPHDDRAHGYLFEANVRRMPWSEDFEVDHSKRIVRLKDPSNGSDPSTACNAAFAKVIDDAIDQDIFRTIHKQHSEPFPILGAKYPVQLERYAADLFGITARGAHLTVYTMTDDGMRIWVPRRNPNMFTYPNKLDTTVAGGITAGETPMQNIIREAQEEASLSADVIEKGIRASNVLTYVSYELEEPGGMESSIVPDVIYVFDLEVGADVTPVPEDGEVKEFYLMGVEETKEALARGEFKTNSAVVMIDFFIRHGIITSENEDDYVEIVQRMHRRLPFPTSS
jgi:8-oxo-dGTP pyrophosphatase MutT (NUDIX family)